MPFVELHVHFVDRPCADEAVGRVAMAGGKGYSEACKENKAFFHALEFEAKVIFFIFVTSKHNALMADNRLQWFKTETKEGRTYVFDPLRSRFVALTPEEEVRQKMLYFLVEHLHVPAGLVAVEYSVKVNGLDKRADAVVFGTEGRPLMIVECKAPSVALTQAVLEQALRYHSALQPKFLLLSNGEAIHCLKVEKGTVQAMDHLPDFVEMQVSASI